MKPTTNDFKTNDFITTCALAAAFVICACAAFLWMIIYFIKIIIYLFTL